MIQRCLPESSARVLVKDANPVVINRFATITQNFCLEAYSDPDEDGSPLRDCPYLLDMLQFCRYRSVYDMFAGFFNEKNPKSQNLWPVIHRERWVTTITDFIRNFPKEFSGKVDDSSQCLEAVMRLIPAMSVAHQLQEDLATADVVRIVAAELTNAPTSLLEAQWAALTALIELDSLCGARGLGSQMDKVFDQLMKINGFTHYQELMLSVLGSMAKIMSMVREKMMERGFDGFLAGVLRACPGHTLAHRSICEFVSKILGHEDLATFIVKPLMAVAIDWFKEDSSVVERAFAWEFGNRIKDCAFLQIDEGFLQKVNEINDAASGDYGGPIDKRERPERPLDPDDVARVLNFFS